MVVVGTLLLVGALAVLDDATASATIASEAGAVEIPKLLILPMKAEAGVEEATGKLLDDVLAVAFARYAGIESISQHDVTEMMDLEAERQAAGCDEASCLAEIAGAMGARYVVSGRIGKLGSRFSFTLSLFDSSEARNVSRANRVGSSLDEIADAIDGQVDELLASMKLSLRPGAKKGMQAAALPPPDKAKNGSGGDDGPYVSLLGIGLTSGFCGGSACVTLGAGIAEYAIFALAATSGSFSANNGRFDWQDFVAPSICGCGALLGIVGLALIPFTWFPDEEEEAAPAADGAS
jgi:TolB-like protein